MNTFVTQLRWPEKLREQVLAELAASGRSMNAEIVYRLQLSFAQQAQSEERAA